jgi:hypothetical protein
MTIWISVLPLDPVQHFYSHPLNLVANQKYFYCELELQPSIGTQHRCLIGILASATASRFNLLRKLAYAETLATPLRGGLTARHLREAQLLCQCFGYGRCYAP